jgi:CBS domain-containing protein
MPMLANVLVKDFMTTDPVTIAATATIEDAIRVMEENNISGLPVVDDQGTLVGILSEGDLLSRESPMKPPLFLSLLGGVIYFESPSQFHQHMKKSLGMLVQDLMTAKPIVTKPDLPLTQAAQIILDRKVNRLPVVDDQGHLVGIITRHDLVQAMKPTL